MASQSYGRTFTSLSAAARAITGCAVNGWRFLSLAGAGAEGKGEAAPAGKGSSVEVYAGGAGSQVAEPRRTCRKVKEACPEGHPREFAAAE